MTENPNTPEVAIAIHDASEAEGAHKSSLVTVLTLPSVDIAKVGVLARCQTLWLKHRLDLATYLEIMAQPTWGYLTQAIHATRSYESGLNGGLLLLRYTEEHARQLGRKEYEANLQRLYVFILGLPDRLDRWEEYLDTWEALRENTTFALTYAGAARRRHGQRLEPFILGDARGVLHIHFLWLCGHGKEVIERKLARRRAGRSIEHLRHAPQELLSDAEIERRLARVLEMAGRASQGAERDRGRDDPSARTQRGPSPTDRESSAGPVP